MALLENKTVIEGLNFTEMSFVEAEKLQQLTPDQLTAIYEKKLFKLFVPSEYGGLGLDLPDALRVEEQLAKLDGSLGWTVTLCAGAALFCGYVDEEVNDLFSKSFDACWGGSGAVGGTAQVKGDSYIVSGQWNYATGGPHCTAFTANCYILDEAGESVLNEAGDSLVKSFVFKPEEVTKVENWFSSGMVATASHGFEINSVLIPRNRSFVIQPDASMREELIFKYPFLQLAESTLAVNFSGMSYHFLDEAERIINSRSNLVSIPSSAQDRLQRLLVESRQSLTVVSERVHEFVAISWKQLALGHIDESLLMDISEASREVRRVSVKLVQLLYPHCGIGASIPDQPINRIFRDIHTASQHNLLLYPRG